MYATHPGDKPWISEMYGYAFGAAKAGVWHDTPSGAMLYPGYLPVGRAARLLRFAPTACGSHKQNRLDGSAVHVDHIALRIIENFDAHF